MIPNIICTLLLSSLFIQLAYSTEDIICPAQLFFDRNELNQDDKLKSILTEFDEGYKVILAPMELLDEQYDDVFELGGIDTGEIPNYAKAYYSRSHIK